MLFMVIEPNFARCFSADGVRRSSPVPGVAPEEARLGRDVRVVPVVASKDTRAMVAPHLDSL
jgi:hypothetical protein